MTGDPVNHDDNDDAHRPAALHKQALPGDQVRQRAEGGEQSTKPADEPTSPPTTRAEIRLEEMPPSVRAWFTERAAAAWTGPPQGSTEDAARLGEGRHPGVRDALQWLTYRHLPQALQQFSAPFYEAAARLVATIATDSPELTTALNRLIEAKDSAVRAGIRHDTGRAGSVPRPQQVVQPPSLTGNHGPGQPRSARLAEAQQLIADNRPNVAQWCSPAPGPVSAVSDPDPTPED